MEAAMTRVSGETILKLLAGISGLIVAVSLTGCGDTGELGSEETTTAPSSESTEESPAADPPAARDTEERTSDDSEEWTEEEEESTEEGTDRGPAEDETEEDQTGEDQTEDEGSGEAHTFSGSGFTVSETAHLEGDYTVAFSVTGNTMMDMESNFIADLVNADDELDFHIIVNDIGTEVNGTTNVYGLDGDYYVDVMAEGEWTIEFTPQ
jgi:hypothetical protein